MSEQNTQFVEYIKENLTGDTQQNALNFVQHLSLIGMTIEDGKVTYKGVTICYTYFGNSSNPIAYPEPWTVWLLDKFVFSKEIDGCPIDERMKEIVWTNAHKCGEPCPNLLNGCSGQRTIIFGREFDNLCGTPIGFTDPNNEAVECINKLMDMRKFAIDSEE